MDLGLENFSFDNYRLGDFSGLGDFTGSQGEASYLNPSGRWSFAENSVGPNLSSWGSRATDFLTNSSEALRGLAMTGATIRDLFKGGGSTNADQIHNEQDRATYQVPVQVGIPTWAIVGGAIVAAVLLLKLVK